MGGGLTGERLRFYVGWVVRRDRYHSTPDGDSDAGPAKSQEAGTGGYVPGKLETGRPDHVRVSPRKRLHTAGVLHT